jgi:hypothetical protein
MAEDLTPSLPDDERPLPVPANQVEVVDASETEIVRRRPGALEVYRGAPPGTYGGRFSFAYGMLAALAVVAAVGAVVAITGYNPTAGPAWSDFEPQGDRLGKAQAIADFVAPHYRLDSGEQIVGVGARKPEVQGAPVEFIAIATQDANGRYNPIGEVNADSTVVYQMCGLGSNCAIRVGDASVDRDRLLRREALELALYSFKYVPSTSSVVIFLPPRAGQKPTWAMLFRRDDYGNQLARPLRLTLAEPVPNPSRLAASPESQLVEALTARRRFAFSFVQGQTGGAILVLDPSKAA